LFWIKERQIILFRPLMLCFNYLSAYFMEKTQTRTQQYNKTSLFKKGLNSLSCLLTSN